jgi:ketosteroid isomerase-like protein
MMRCLHVGLLVMLTCLAPIPRVDAQPAEREAVLKARETALLARDVGAVLPLFADDALVVTSSGRFLTGRDQIKTGVQDRGERGQREEAGPRYL